MCFPSTVFTYAAISSNQMLRHAWKVLPEVSLPQRGSFISSHAKIAGSSRFVEDARRELQGIVVVAVSKSPGAHHCHAHSGGFLEHLRHGRPGRLVCSSVHQPVDVGAVHVERLPSQAVASSRNRAEMTK